MKFENIIGVYNSGNYKVINIFGIKLKFKNKQAAQNKLDQKRIPAHVAIIMDGNGRWAINIRKTINNYCTSSSKNFFKIQGDK
jgi:hypothetical protein